jgi:hypothetical protein
VVCSTAGPSGVSDAACHPPYLGPPPDWDDATAVTGGAVVLPDHIDPTNPRRVYDLDDPAERKYVYEIVLTDGTGTDINRLIDPTLLAQLWDRLYLADDLRAAWAPTVVAHPSAPAESERAATGVHRHAATMRPHAGTVRGNLAWPRHGDGGPDRVRYSSTVGG